MASSFLKKKAEEQAKKIDKQYGQNAYGGSKWREEKEKESSGSKAAGASSPSSTTQKETSTTNNQTTGTTTTNRASSSLQKRARAQAQKVDERDGGNAYGGSKWRDTTVARNNAVQNATPVKDSTKPNSGYTIDDIRQNLEDSYTHVAESEAALNEFLKKYGATHEDIQDKLATAYGAKPDATGRYIFDDELSYNDYLKEFAALSALSSQYVDTAGKYNEWYDLAENYKSTATEGEIWGNAIRSGLAQADAGFFGSLDWLEQNLITKPLGALLGNDELYKNGIFYGIHNYYSDLKDYDDQQLADALIGKGKFAQIGAELITGATAAAPNAILASMTGGTSAAAQGTAALTGAASTGLGATISSAVTTMAKNPLYWSSVAQTLGPAYEEAINNGATEMQANATALISSLLNAGVETSGGIEVLPARLRGGDTNAILAWVMSMPEEGLEEVIQRMVSGSTDKIIYDHDKPIYSNTDPNAIVNPKDMGKEFAMGAGVAAILGGPQTVAVKTGEAINNRRYGKIGNEYQIAAEDVIAEGLTFDENTEAYKIASKLQAALDSGKKVSNKDLGKAVAANARAVAEEAKRNEAEAKQAVHEAVKDVNVEDVIREGLSYGEDTAAFRMAAELEEKWESLDDISEEEIYTAIKYNEIAAREADGAAGSPTAVSEADTTLEDLARETVAERNGTAQSEDMGQETGIPKVSIPYNAMSMENPVRQTVMAEKQGLKKKMGYGEEGWKLFESIASHSGIDETELTVRFDTPYQAGLTGLPMDKVSLIDDFQLEAYNAGRMDHIARMAKDKEHKAAVVFSFEESGFDFSDAPPGLTQEQKDFAVFLTKQLGVKGYFDGQNGKANYNALFNKNTGITAFARDFEINPRLMKQLGSMDYMEKMERMATERGESFVFYLAHEIATHAAMDRAPEAMRSFVNAMYNYKQSKAGEGNLARKKQAFYFDKKADLTTEGAIEEVVADAILDLYDGDEKAFMDAMRAVLSGKDTKAAEGAKTYKNWLDRTIQKLKAWVRKLTGKENAEARENLQQGITELEKLRNMFEQAIAEAGKNVAAARAAKQDVAAVREGLGAGAVIQTNKNGDLLTATSKDGSTIVYSYKTYKDGGKDKLREALLRNGHTRTEIDSTLALVDDAADYLTILAAGYAKSHGYTALSDHLVADIITNLKTGKQVMSALVNNGDYPVNIDLALICKKRIAYMNLMTRLIEDGIFDMVNYKGEAIADVNDILRANGFETACLGCFVESRRLQFQAWAETIVSEWNAEVDKRKKNAGSFGFSNGRVRLTDAEMDSLSNELKNAGKKNKQGNLNLGKGSAKVRIGRLLDMVPSLQQHLTVADLLTPSGLAALREYDSNIFSIVKSRYGAASPKIVQDFNPYASEIAMMTFKSVSDITSNAVKGAQEYIKQAKKDMGGIKKREGETDAAFRKRRAEHNAKAENEAMRRYLYDIGGARIQSFSDFMIENVFDYLQITADLAANRFPLHGYTKETICLRLLGMTGAKWNGSLIAHTERSMGKEYAGLLPASAAKDGSAILVHTDEGDFAIGFDDYARNKATGGKSFIQSIGMKDIIALQLDPRYSRNVGSITIGVSDKQILAMLDSPLFSMVIPYHASGMLPGFAQRVGVDMYNDYTDYQNTRVRQLYDKDGNMVESLVDAKGDAIKIDTSFAFNAEIQKTGDARTAANNYIKWCAERHPVYDGKTLVGYATFSPKFSDSPYGTDFSRHPNYYKLLEDFNTYDCITGESAVQGPVTMTFPDESNRMSAAEMDAYKQRLRETGIFSEKEIEKYAAIANKTFKELVADEIKGRADYKVKQDAKWEKTVAEIKKKLMSEYARDGVSSEAKELSDSDTQFSLKTARDDGSYAPTFYSKMEQVVQNVKQEKLGASSVVSMLKGKGVKDEEIKWSGIEAWLEGKKSVTKQEVLEFIRANDLEIEETELGETLHYTDEQQQQIDEISRKNEELMLLAEEKWFEITGQNMPFDVMGANDVYLAAKRKLNAKGLGNTAEAREILETLRTVDNNNTRLDILASEAKKTGDAARWQEYTLEGGENYREILFNLPGSDYTNMAMEAHWGEETGVLAHARLQDFDTADGRMLFVEEIQSDWHNAGHKSGYRKNGEKTHEMLRRESDDAYDKFYSVVEGFVEENSNFEDDGAPYYAHPVVVAEMFDGDESHFGQLKFTEEQKHTIREMVAEEAERQKALETAPWRSAALDAPFKDTYHEFVLKRLLRMAAEGGYSQLGWTTAEIQSDRWSDEYAEGYRIEYDQDIPKFLNKYGKKWGAVVSKTKLEDGTEIWSMDITDAMRESVLHEGQPQYSLKGEQEMRREIDRIRSEGRKAGKSKAEIESDVMGVVGPEYGKLLKTYGEIKRGERPYREIETPKKSEKKRKVSQTVRTILEAGVTPDAAIPNIQEMVVSGDFSYDVYTDAAAIKIAEDTIKKKGYGVALAEWIKAVEGGNVSKTNTAIGWALYNQAATSGDLATAMTVLNHIVGHQRSAAQAVQATRILKKLEPDAQLYGVVQSVQKLEEGIAKNKKSDPVAAGKAAETVGEAKKDAADAAKKAPNRVKVKKGGKRVVVEGNQAGEPFVFEYAQKVGEALAKGLEAKRNRKPKMPKTFLQQIVTELNRFASEKLPKEQKGKSLTAVDLLRDYIQNQSFYAEAWQAAQQELRAMYADDEFLGEFVNSGIGVDANTNPQNAIFMRALVTAAADSGEGKAMLKKQEALGFTGMADTIADDLIHKTGAEGEMADTIRDAAYAYVQDTLRDTDADDTKFIESAIRSAMKDIGLKLSDVVMSGTGESAKQNIVNKLVAKYGFGRAEASNTADIVFEQFDKMSRKFAEGRLKSMFADRKNVQRTIPEKIERLARLGAFDAGSAYNEQAAKRIFQYDVPLTVDETLAKEFLMAKTQDERDDILKKIYLDIGRQMPSTFMDKWNAWRYLAMLGNPRTHVRNVVGNAGFAPVVITKDLTATFIESMVGFVSRGKMGRTKAMPGAKLLKAAWDDYANVADQITAGGKYNDAAMKNQYIEEGRVIFDGKLGKPIEKARKLNSAAMETEDMWFAQPHYAFALAQYCKANGVTVEQLRNGKALGNARDYAIREAKKATYRDANAFSETIGELGKYHGDNKVKKGVSMVTEGILPFRKTPANILVRGIEYSPIGLVNGIKQALWDVQKGNKTAAEAIDNIAAGLVGTGLLRLGIYLAAEGLIRGAGGDDEEEKKFDELQGHQAYALELPNGKSVTLDWLAPEVLPLFIGVNLYEMASANKGKSNLADILTAVSNVTAPLLEMSCLQSLNDLFDSVGYAASGGGLSALPTVLVSAATSYLTQGFPTILGQAERSAQDVRMTTYTEKDAFLTSDLQYTLGKISAKLPGWDFNQIPYVDAWGRQESTGSKGANAANNFLNPAYTSQIETSAMEEELQRLHELKGDDYSVLPSRADKYISIDGERKNLTGEEYVEYATAKGQLSYNILTDLTGQDGYASLPDAEKARAVEMAYEYANALAKTTVSDYEPDGWVASALKAEEFSGMDETEYILYKMALNMADQNNPDGTKNSFDSTEKAAAISSLSWMSDADIAAVMDSDAIYAAYDADIDMRTIVDYIGAGNSFGKAEAEKLIGAKNAGISETTYFGYKDTLKAVDQPNKNGEYGGSATSAEKAAAVAKMKDLDDQGIAYFWGTDQAQEAHSYGVDMRKYAQFKGVVDSFKGQDKQQQIESYLKGMNLSAKDYLYLYGTVYPSVKDDADYLYYFGK